MGVIKEASFKNLSNLIIRKGKLVELSLIGEVVGVGRAGIVDEEASTQEETSSNEHENGHKGIAEPPNIGHTITRVVVAVVGTANGRHSSDR